MSQNDMSIANQTFPATRSDINSALQALVTLSSGASEPGTMYAYQLWADATTGLLKIRNAANNAWITIGTLASTNLGLLALSGGSLTGALNLAKGSDIASGTTTDIGAATGTVVDVTGTTTITGFGTAQAGTMRIVRFTGALTLTHNATSLILPTAANITTAAGDVAIFISLGSGNWYCAFFQRKSGEPLYSPGRLLGVQYFTTPGTATYTPTAGTASVIVEVWGAGGSGGVGTSSGAGCGSAGAYSRKRLTSAFSGVTITVGAGGASVTSGSNATGNNGGSSSFGAICSSSGGIAGTAGGAGPNIALVGASNLYGSLSVGGTASGGDVNISGSCSYSIFIVGAATGMGFGGAAPSGAAAGKSLSTNGNGTSGVFPGGGGTFAITGGSNSSGAGADGMVLIWEYS